MTNQMDINDNLGNIDDGWGRDRSGFCERAGADGFWDSSDDDDEVPVVPAPYVHIEVPFVVREGPEMWARRRHDDKVALENGAACCIQGFLWRHCFLGRRTLMGIVANTIARYLVSKGMKPIRFGLDLISNRLAVNVSDELWKTIRVAVVRERERVRLMISRHENILHLERLRAVEVATERKEFERSMAEQKEEEEERRSWLSTEELSDDVNLNEGFDEEGFYATWAAGREMDSVWRRTGLIRDRFSRGWKGSVEDRRYLGPCGRASNWDY